MKELPQPCIAPSDEEVNKAADNIDKMQIAWRYEGLNQVESSFGSNTDFGHHFDLSKHIDEDTIKNSSILFCNTNANQQTYVKSKSNTHFKYVKSVIVYNNVI